jgi:predicted ABC-type ATPase
LESGNSFGLESTLSGTTYAKLLHQAKAIGFQIEIHYLWIPSPSLVIRLIAQRVKMGGYHIPEADIRRRFARSWTNPIHLYGPLADTWQIWDNRNRPPSLLVSSESSTLALLGRLP